MASLSVKHLVGIKELSKEDIDLIFKRRQLQICN